MRTLFFLPLFAVLTGSALFTQNTDEEIIRKIFDDALLHEDALTNLEWLCSNAPGRMVGSSESEKALAWFAGYLKKAGADTVFMQTYTTPAWKHISSAARIFSGDEEVRMRTVALGPSPATPASGITAGVIEVKGLDELKQLPEELVDGKIVFFNRPVDYTRINTFRAYGGAVDQRIHGPALAAAQGAAAVLVRSVTTAYDTIPHTGTTKFDSLRIPCAAISQVDADILSGKLKSSPQTRVWLKIESMDINSVTTHNLVADLRGTVHPEKYIIVGGHIDSWFNTPGAHDDGAGCVQSVDLLRIFRSLDLKPKNTIRVVLFMDEELYQSGGKAWAEYVKENDLKIVAALEADAGGFAPDGFTVDADSLFFSQVVAYKPLLEPYGIHFIRKGGSGVDIFPMKQLNVPLLGYRTGTQRYMDIHHSAADSFDKVNKRELLLGSGCMASLIYLIDRNMGDKQLQ
ncbi:MAG: M28 family peptidase [Bacteroidales bacterium]